jgi:hypothetical protein
MRQVFPRRGQGNSFFAPVPCHAFGVANASREKPGKNERGQGNIIVFPIFILLILGAWLLAMTTLLDASQKTSTALNELNERRKEIVDATLDYTSLPSLTVFSGSVKNTGVMGITNLKLYHLQNSTISQRTVTSELVTDQEASFNVSTLSYGDILLAVSDQDFWGKTLIPVQKLNNAGLNRIVSGATILVDQQAGAPSQAYHSLGSPNAQLLNASKARGDNDTYSVNQNAQVEFEWNFGSSCYEIGTQVQIYGNVTGGSAVTLTLSPHDGQNYVDAYDCVFQPGYSNCVSPNLSGDLKADANNIFKMRMKNTGGSFVYDYVLLDLRCVA